MNDVHTRGGAATFALICLLGSAGPTGLAAQTATRGPGEALVRGLRAPEATGIIDLPRLSGLITLDGISDEAAWQAIPSLPLTMYQPTFRGESNRDIEVRVGYDDEAIYLSARFFQDPDDIRAFSYTRDRYGGDDGIGLLLDTFNDNENAVRFNGLPLGTRMDMAISQDGIAGGPGNLSWNTFWDFVTETDEEGWSAELRVPFSSLRFRTEPDGSVVMGMMGFVYQSGIDSRFTYPAMDSSLPYARPSGFQKVRLRDIEPTNPIYFSPYGLLGSTRQSALNGPQDAWVASDAGDYEVGADLKLTPTPNLTLDLTINTDFAAVEADQQQVNLTRFSLFFEEKRPFFQERAGLFGFETGADRGTLFYSRRIGLGEDRLPVRLLGGARLVGRLGAWDVGVIEMQTGTDRGLRSENFGVIRARRSVLNANSFVGAMGTSRVNVDGVYNVSYGIDGLFRAIGDEYVTLKWLQTFQGGDGALRDAAPSGLDAGRVVFDWTRRRNRGLSYQHVFVWSGAGFDPAVGFDPRSDYKRGQSDWNYNWLLGDASKLRRLWLGTKSNVWIRNADGRVDTGEVSPFFQIETNLGVILKVSSKTSFENVPDTFSLASAEVPSGTYWATEGAVELRAARAWPIRPNITVTGGQFFDGNRVGVRTDTEWPLGSHLSLQGAWEWNRIRFEERGQSFDSNLVRLTVRAALDTKLSMFVFGQYNSLTDELTTNTRLRYNFREGQDLWIVWNEGLNLERDVLGVPRLPFEQTRTFTLKYTHTFIF